MSFRVVGKVLRRPREPLARRMILIVLAEAAHDDGISWVPQEQIATKACLARGYVNEQIKELAVDGVIEIRKAQRGRKRIAVYRLMLQGLDEPEYDRLPFTLDAQFSPLTTSGELTSSEMDDVRIDALTTSESAGAIARARSSCLKSKENGKESPSDSLVVQTVNGVSFGERTAIGVPKAVDRKPVKKHEADLAVDVLAEWNAQSGQKLTNAEHVRKIIMRHREHPELVVSDHAHLIAVTLSDPWWEGTASPSVLYGNGAIFERAMMTAMRRTGPEKKPRWEGAAQLAERMRREGM